MKRNKHLLCSKTGKKYAVDRCNWTTYLNFEDMYNHIEDILVSDSKIARKLEKPRWMDRDGNFVESEEESFGCKVEIVMERPDLAIVFDEVGCNLSQECDNANGGELYLTGVHDQAYNSCATRHSHFTCIGVTTLEGKPLMCVIIMSGKKFDVGVAEGIDWNKIDINDEYDFHEDDEYVFLKNNRGEGRYSLLHYVCVQK